MGCVYLEKKTIKKFNKVLDPFRFGDHEKTQQNSERYCSGVLQGPVT